MRKRHFYSHLVEFESIYVALQEVQLSSQEREHLVSVAESSLHHVVMDAILSELSEGDKKMLLSLTPENYTGLASELVSS